MLNRDDIEALRAAQRIEEVVEQYVERRPSGRCLIGRCPFHEDRRPSFTVFPNTQTWWCFACNIGGDVFNFVERIERVSFREAMERLGHVEGTTQRPTQDPVGKATSKRLPSAYRLLPAASLTPEHFTLLTAATEVYHAALFTRPDLLRYLAQRGLDAEAIHRYRLGYASGQDLARYFRYRGWNSEIARDLGLIGPYGEYFRERIVIPELREGRAIYLVGRATVSKQRAKYIGLPGAPKPLYGAESLRGAQKVFVVEGPFDLLTLLNWGYAARCLLGSHLKREHEREFDGISCIYLALDNDDEGRAATEQLAKLFGPRAIVVPHLKGVKDVNELATRPDGCELFARLVRVGEARWRENHK
jgi:DNA primase